MFGLCVGNVVALPSLSIQREFAAASLGLVLGLSVAIGQVGYFCRPRLCLGSYAISRAAIARC
jgi:hypothetical protein